MSSSRFGTDAPAEADMSSGQHLRTRGGTRAASRKALPKEPLAFSEGTGAHGAFGADGQDIGDGWETDAAAIAPRTCCCMMTGAGWATVGAGGASPPLMV